MRVRFIAALVAVLLSSSAFAAGSYQPPTTGPEGCVSCEIDQLLMTVTCVASDDDPSGQHWTGCQGGWYCQSMPGGGVECHPDCGSRCMYV